MLTVPASAVRYEAGGPVLMVLDNTNTVHRTPVKLGERVGDFVQIVEGPAAGVMVLAIGASFTLDGDVITPVEDKPGTENSADVTASTTTGVKTQ